jgi:hypothetical protein
MPAKKKPKALLHPRDAGRVLGISPHSLMQLVKAGLLPPPVNISRGQRKFLRWRRADLEAYAAGKAVPA